MQSVRVMLSYDYSHFEVCLGVPDDATLKDVNEARKSAQRLCDEAVRQYKVAKEMMSKAAGLESEREYLESIVESANEKPESEWTPREKAASQKLLDAAYWESSKYLYDYDDDDEPDF
jgi:hypothetical protein